MRDDAGRGAEAAGESRTVGSGDEGSGRGAERAPESDEERSGNVAGEFRPAEPIEPGSPKLGNALFVIAGAYITVLGLTRLFVGVGGFETRDVLVLTAGMVLVSMAFLWFLGLLTPDT